MGSCIKTYIIQFIYNEGNGWAFVNAHSVNQAEQVFKIQTKYKDIRVTGIKETKYYGEEMQLVYEGAVTSKNKSLYDLAILNGFKGSLEEFFESLRGEKGEKGEDGVHVTSLVKTSTSGLTDIYTITFSDNTTQTFTITNGQTGETGPVGPIGFTGKSAYQSYYDTTQDNPKKTEVEWLESLKGEDGDPGATGSQGPVGPKGDNGVGFASASSPSTADGTWQITLTNGDTITIDLNHVHPQYLKYELVQSLPASPDSGTLYLIAAE